MAIGLLIVAPLSAITATVVASGATGLGDPASALLTYGPLGVMVVLLVTGILVPKPTHDRVVKENEALRELIDSKVYPAIENSTAAIRESNETIRDSLRMLVDQGIRPPPRRRKPSV